MKKDQPSIEILKEMFIEFTEHKNNLLRTKKKNDDEIEGIERYLNSFFNNEEFNYKVFSPRYVESIYKEEIEEQNLKKSMIENDNHFLIKNLAFLVDKIEKFETLINLEKIRESEDRVREKMEEEQAEGKLRIEEILQEEERLQAEGKKQAEEKLQEEERLQAEGKKQAEEKLQEEERTQAKEKKQAEDKLQIDESLEQINLENAEQSLKVLHLQELERQRIARDLHDSTVQNLVHLIHKIELCSKFMDQDILRARLEIATITKEIKNVINDMRDIIFNLRSMTFDDIGWEATVLQLFEELQNKTNLTITHNVEDISLYNSMLQISVVRIVQECCMNSIKHSEGQNLDITVKSDSESLTLIIKDDGKGFQEMIEEDSNISRHFGLAMTRERVQLLSGTMKINTNREIGTEIIIKIPETNNKVQSF